METNLHAHQEVTYASQRWPHLRVLVAFPQHNTPPAKVRRGFSVLLLNQLLLLSFSNGTTHFQQEGPVNARDTLEVTPITGKCTQTTRTRRKLGAMVTLLLVAQRLMSYSSLLGLNIKIIIFFNNTSRKYISMCLCFYFLKDTPKGSYTQKKGFSKHISRMQRENYFKSHILK